MLFPTLKLPLDGLANEVGLLFVGFQGGLNPGQRPRRETGRGLFVVDLRASALSHDHYIDDITNCYKPHFMGVSGFICRYLLLTLSELVISLNHQTGRTQMTTKTQTQKIKVERFGVIHTFDNRAEASRFIERRACLNELWDVVR